MRLQALVFISMVLSGPSSAMFFGGAPVGCGDRYADLKPLEFDFAHVTKKDLPFVEGLGHSTESVGADTASSRIFKVNGKNAALSVVSLEDNSIEILEFAPQFRDDEKVKRQVIESLIELSLSRHSKLSLEVTAEDKQMRNILAEMGATKVEDKHTTIDKFVFDVGNRRPPESRQKATGTKTCERLGFISERWALGDVIKAIRKMDTTAAVRAKRMKEAELAVDRRTMNLMAVKNENFEVVGYLIIDSTNGWRIERAVTMDGYDPKPILEKLAWTVKESMAELKVRELGVRESYLDFQIALRNLGVKVDSAKPYSSEEFPFADSQEKALRFIVPQAR